MKTAQVNLEMSEWNVRSRVWRERAVPTASRSAQSCQGGVKVKCVARAGPVL